MDSLKKEQKKYQNAVRKLQKFAMKDGGVTYGHSKRVGIAAKMLAEELGKTDEECIIIERAGTLHDVGKLKINLGILNKESGLTDDEYLDMQQHSTFGLEKLKEFGLTRPEYIEAAGAHHKSADGSLGFKSYGAEGIAVGDVAKIIAISDVFDALAYPRGYKDAMPKDKIISIMDGDCKTGKFDAGMYKIFMDKCFDALISERDKWLRERSSNELTAVSREKSTKVELDESLEPRDKVGDKSKTVTTPGE